MLGERPLQRWIREEAISFGCFPEEEEGFLPSIPIVIFPMAVIEGENIFLRLAPCPGRSSWVMMPVGQSRHLNRGGEHLLSISIHDLHLIIH